MKDFYLSQVWAARYFWIHLALADLRARWRRSFLGMLWSIIQPLGLTVLISLVFSRMFGTDITRHAPYILSGLIVWEFVTATSTGGALSFVQADAYIKQFRHPLAIYPLRTMLTNLMVLGTASLALFACSAVILPQNIGLAWFSVLTLYPVAALIAWPLATLLAYIGVRFRDVPHALGLLFQAVWFVSPVYFPVEIFRKGGLDSLIDHNPVYHLLQIFRAPLLDGRFPVIENYLYSLGAAAVFILLAYLVGRKTEGTVIFYL